MSPAVHGVLIVPEAGDPLGLLAEGPLGARPPAAILAVCSTEGCPTAFWIEEPSYGLRRPCERCSSDQGTVWLRLSDTRALALWWDGQVVPAGMDRYLRAYGRAPHHLKDFGVEAALIAAMLRAQADSSRPVAIDTQGREMDLVSALDACP